MWCDKEKVRESEKKKRKPVSVSNMRAQILLDPKSPSHMSEEA